jgi:hypothetical protein
VRKRVEKSFLRELIAHCVANSAFLSFQGSFKPVMLTGGAAGSQLPTGLQLRSKLGIIKPNAGSQTKLGPTGSGELDYLTQ